MPSEVAASAPALGAAASSASTYNYDLLLGQWVIGCTVVLVVAKVAWRYFQYKRASTIAEVLKDTFDGATAVPFGFMALSVFSEVAYSIVLGNRSLMAIAGLVGLLVTLAGMVDRRNAPLQALLARGVADTDSRGIVTQ